MEAEKSTGRIHTKLLLEATEPLHAPEAETAPYRREEPTPLLPATPYDLQAVKEPSLSERPRVGWRRLSANGPSMR